MAHRDLKTCMTFVTLHVPTTHHLSAFWALFGAVLSQRRSRLIVGQVEAKAMSAVSTFVFAQHVQASFLGGEGRLILIAGCIFCSDGQPTGEPGRNPASLSPRSVSDNARSQTSNPQPTFASRATCREVGGLRHPVNPLAACGHSKKPSESARNWRLRLCPTSPIRS